MTSRVLPNLAVALVLVLVVALLNGGGWPFWLMGGVFALALAVGVWFGSAPAYGDWTLRPPTYAAAAAVALVVGGLAWWISGADNNAFWGVGVIAGIASSASATAWHRSR